MITSYLNRNKFLLALFITPLSICCLIWGFNNEKDPEWIRLDTLISAPLLSVAESMDSVRILANGDADFDAKKRLTNPYVPTMTFEKFKSNYPAAFV